MSADEEYQPDLRWGELAAGLATLDDGPYTVAVVFPTSGFSAAHRWSLLDDDVGGVEGSEAAARLAAESAYLDLLEGW